MVSGVCLIDLCLRFLFCVDGMDIVCLLYLPSRISSRGLEKQFTVTVIVKLLMCLSFGTFPPPPFFNRNIGGEKKRGRYSSFKQVFC